MFPCSGLLGFNVFRFCLFSGSVCSSSMCSLVPCVLLIRVFSGSSSVCSTVPVPRVLRFCVFYCSGCVCSTDPVLCVRLFGFRVFLRFRVFYWCGSLCSTVQVPCVLRFCVSPLAAIDALPGSPGRQRNPSQPIRADVESPADNTQRLSSLPFIRQDQFPQTSFINIHWWPKINK